MAGNGAVLVGVEQVERLYSISTGAQAEQPKGWRARRACACLRTACPKVRTTQKKKAPPASPASASSLSERTNRCFHSQRQQTETEGADLAQQIMPRAIYIRFLQY